MRDVAILLPVQVEELRLVGEDLLMDLLDQAAPFLQVAGELVDELLEALAPLRTGRVLVRGRDRRVDGQCVADEQCDGLDQDGLVAFEPVELAGQLVEPLGDRRLAPVAAVRGQVGRVSTGAGS